MIVSRRALVVSALLLATGGLTWWHADVAYRDIDAAGRIARMIGYAAGPWLLAYMIAGVRWGLARLRGSPITLAKDVLWSAGALLALRALFEVS